MRKLYFYLLASFLLGVSLLACKPWDDHLALSDDKLGRNLLEEISNQPNLSKFKDLLVSSGFDKIISSSKNYTVFAPTNTALEKLDLSTLKDSTALKAFVGNHIALQQYALSTEEQRVRLLNDKYLSITKTAVGDAGVVSANSFVSNGVLHTIDKYNDVLPNLWTYVNNTKTDYVQNKVLANLTYLSFNAAKAIVDSISATTGQPVYRKGSGFEQKNQFSDLVYDLSDETKQFTYFVLADAAFASEITKLNPYFKTSTTDSTYNAASWNVIKDLAVEGYYNVDKLPESLTSKFGVTIPIVKSAIVKSIKLSNGILHVMSKVDFKVQEKIQPIVIQGETYNEQLQTVGSRVIVVRDRFNLVTNQNFKDLSIIAHGVSNFWVKYRVPQVPAMKYKVYWVALNDQTRNHSSNSLPITVNQKLAMGSLSSATFAYTAVANNNFSEVLLGEFTTTGYRTLDIYLVANGTNSMALDYIKLVPSF
ncbi:MAG: fasciclin domain-containing protein [Spirosomataceae bacterium]